MLHVFPVFKTKTTSMFAATIMWYYWLNQSTLHVTETPALTTRPSVPSALVFSTHFHSIYNMSQIHTVYIQMKIQNQCNKWFTTSDILPPYWKIKIRISLTLWGDKVSILTHTYPHKPKIKVTICNHQADNPLYVWPDVWFTPNVLTDHETRYH